MTNNDACRCAVPKPVRVEDETFEGLFTDEPVTRTHYLYCDQCAGVVMRAVTAAPNATVSADDYTEANHQEHR